MVARWWVLMATAAAASLVACAPEQQQMANQRPTTAPPLQPVFALGETSEPIALERVVFLIRSGTKIGQHAPCWICPFSNDVHFDGGSTTLRSAAYGERFFETMTAAGYRVAGDPRQMFDRSSERAAARFIVGAQITDLQFELRQGQPFLTRLSGGQAELQVTWQVYSLRDRRVVYETKTAGKGSIYREGHEGAFQALVLEAFDAATTILAADAGFQKIVSGARPSGGVVAASLSAGDEFELPRFFAFQGPIGGRMRDVNAAAVTIVTSVAHGSGFFVSEDGLILTNDHVVGSADQVNVRLPSGVEVSARVLRRHAARDVALIKAEIARTRPLPIRLAPVAPGDEVYALGSPADTQLAGTLTRGIVSAVRINPAAGNELPLIQSDAAIYGGSSGGPLLDASGNVVGIAVARRRESTALNFFIPIDDALRYLNIPLGQPRELRF